MVFHLMARVRKEDIKSQHFIKSVKKRTDRGLTFPTF